MLRSIPRSAGVGWGLKLVASVQAVKNGVDVVDYASLKGTATAFMLFSARWAPADLSDELATKVQTPTYGDVADGLR